MEVVSRDYEVTNFKYEGTFNPEEKNISQPKLGLRLNSGIPTKLEMKYALYADGKNGESLEFDLEATILMVQNMPKLDAEEILYVVLDAAENAYKLLMLECTTINKNVFPTKPELNKEEIKSLIQRELDELGI